MRSRRLGTTLAVVAMLAVLAPSSGATGTDDASSAQPTAIRFIDVPAGSWYADAVSWAVDEGVTTGASATTFNPQGTTTRAMAITLLWRLAGSPTDSPTDWFTDVPVTSWYRQAAHWALEEGLTFGKGGTSGSPTRTFAPLDKVTRAQFVTLLWRKAGSPLAPGAAGFVDTVPGSSYVDAADWAAFQGLTTGVSGSTSFAPGASLTRAEAVVFLKRFDDLGLPQPTVSGELYNDDGPFKVGLRETTVGNGTYAAVLYPVDTAVADGLTPTRAISSAEAFGPPGSATRQALTAAIPALVLPIPVELYRDAPIAAAGADGVVLSSHGFGGDPRFVLNHLAHYASWGYVVVAPSHPARNLATIAGGFLTGQFPTSIDVVGPVDDAVAAISRVRQWATTPSDSFNGKVDVTRLAAEGHSAGGATIGQTTVNGTAQGLVARGENVRTLIGWATVRFSNATAVPTLVVPGARDGVVTASAGPSSYFPQLDVPRQLVQLANAGHNPVLDICPIIRARGGLGLTGTLAPLALLGEDGCRNGYLLPGVSTALIRHLAVAQVRWAFGQDATRDQLSESFLRQRFRAGVGTTLADTVAPASVDACPQSANFPDLSGAAGAGTGYAKPSVQVSCTGTELVVQSNDMPSYTFNQITPNGLQAQTMTWRVPKSPALAASPTSIVNRLGTLGFSVTGLAIYGPTEGPMPQRQAFGDPVYNGILDSCKGHTGPQSEYHLHAVEHSSSCGFAASPIVGYALDGFPIYGPRGCLDSACTEVVTFTSGYQLTGNPTSYSWNAYTYRSSANPTVLDACNGRVGPDGTYRYHATAGFPYTFGCFAGTPTAQAGSAAAPMPPMN